MPYLIHAPHVLRRAMCAVALNALVAACAREHTPLVGPQSSLGVVGQDATVFPQLGPGITRTFLPPLVPQGTATATAVNSAGVVTGYSFVNAPGGGGTWHAVRWVGGVITDLDGGNPASSLSWTSDINESGAIVGQFTDAQGTAQAANFAFTPPHTTPPLPGDLSSQAMAINTAGDLLGKSESASGIPRYFVVRGGVQTLFDPQHGFPVEAHDLNDAGDVAFNDAKGFHQPVAGIASANGTVRWLPAVNASNSGWIRAINAFGQATGFTLGASGVGFRAVYWTHGQGMELPLPPGQTDCEGEDISNAGVIAMTCSNPFQLNFEGFVWDGHVARSLGRVSFAAAANQGEQKLLSLSQASQVAGLAMINSPLSVVAAVWSYPVTPPLDVDADGVLDRDDDCPFVANPSQTDADGDGIGDACDANVGADLALVVAPPLVPIQLNQTVVLDLAERNVGPQPSSGATLIMPSSPGFRFVSAANTTCTPISVGLQCSLGALGVGGQFAFSVTLRAARLGTFPVALILTGAAADPNQENSIRTARVTVH